MRDWINPTEHRLQKKEQMEQEAQQMRAAGKSLLTDQERADMPIEKQRLTSYKRWMSLRYNYRADSVDLTIVGDAGSRQHTIATHHDIDERGKQLLAAAAGE